ncbi:MAG: flagellar assembly protein FliW [Acidobacteria bacterium]|nr:flagellar assembly protein FliW [Acidobacteriota bacterium]
MDIDADEHPGDSHARLKTEMWVEYSDSDIFEFPCGLPGFEQEKRFLLMERPALRPVVFLQSLSNPELCFITLPARSVDPRYELNMAPDELNLLGLATEETGACAESLSCLAIVCLNGEGPATANLLGPVVLSRETRKGIQSVRDDRRYSALTPVGANNHDRNNAEATPAGIGAADRFAEV